MADHSLLFYEDEGVLTETVAEFVAAGLRYGGTVLVLATSEHVLAIREVVSELGVDLDDALRSGRLRLLDARATLASLLAVPERLGEEFDAQIGALIADVDPASPLRVYEELVDLLCQDGEASRALQLEQSWAALLDASPFRLLRAYAKGRAHRPREPIAEPPSFRSEAAAKLEERRPDEASFRLLVDSVSDYAIFMLDKHGVISTWNAGARRIKGYAAQEIIGQHFSIFYPAEDVATGKCERELDVASVEGHFEDEGWRLRKDGSRFWASVVITALYAGGELVGFAKVTRDLTERRRADETRQRLARAEEANSIKDDFLATVSHELRTPLNAILGWSVLLRDRAKDPSMAKTLATIARNAQAQARLIDELLDVSRIIAGKLRLELKSTDLVTIVREAIEVVRPSAVAKSIELRFECEAPATRLDADPARLEQVVLNILSNAIKFTDGGEIVVRLALRASEICLSVRDTGRGIEAELLPHVFERFRQGDAARTRETGGLGLGLAIVHHLVHLHGGTITADSEGLGRGATFTILLPVRESVRSGSTPDVQLASGA